MKTPYENIRQSQRRTQRGTWRRSESGGGGNNRLKSVSSRATSCRGGTQATASNAVTPLTVVSAEVVGGAPAQACDNRSSKIGSPPPRSNGTHGISVGQSGADMPLELPPGRAWVSTEESKIMPAEAHGVHAIVANATMDKNTEAFSRQFNCNSACYRPMRR